jgi:DNA-binding NtrC family response regulator
VATAYGDSERTIRAMRDGAFDYLTKPFDLPALRAAVARAVKQRALSRAAPEPGPSPATRGDLIGTSAAMLVVWKLIGRAASSRAPVLITGETGTGKELTAELIHRASRRRLGPFVRINCAAIPDGLLESELFGHERGAFTGASAASAGKVKLADGGTMLFDEIGDMSPYAQAKILRLIESKEIERLGGTRSIPVDVRVIAATNQGLEQLMADGRFRKDLYFRLNVVRVHLPPLHERREDVPELLEHYVREFNRELGRNVDGFTEDALNALSSYEWPGNVRELRNLVEMLFTETRAPRISVGDLPPLYQHPPTTIAPVDERNRLLSALLATHWNKSRTAERLHWSRMTVYRKMAKYHLAETNPAPCDGTDLPLPVSQPMPACDTRETVALSPASP